MITRGVQLDPVGQHKRRFTLGHIHQLSHEKGAQVHDYCQRRLTFGVRFEIFNLVSAANYSRGYYGDDFAH